MMAVVLKVICEYKIGGQIGFFMLDNASSNNVCIDLILQMLYPNMSEKQHRRRRLQCLGHVINLAAQIFLLGKKAENTLDKLQMAYLCQDYEKITGI